MVSPAVAVRLWLDVENRGLEQLGPLALSPFTQFYGLSMWSCLGFFTAEQPPGTQTSFQGAQVSKANKDAVALRFMT